MCDYELTWQYINEVYFNNFIRDLSINHTSNINDIITDYKNKSNKDKSNKNKSNKNKSNKNKANKKHKNKKEIIIENQEKLKEKETIQLDDEKITYFLKDINKKTIYQNISYIETKAGINKYKLELLKYFWNQPKKDMNIILSLYFQINNTTDKIIISIKNKLKGYNKFLYILKECGYLLPPLNFWEQKKFSLDEWQYSVIDEINKNNSIIVKAPTSSGKSFLALSTSCFYKKILYICPTSPIIYQVGSYFIKMGYKVQYLVDNIQINDNNNCNIFIGDPTSVEYFLPKLNFDFDYAVLDEIHNLNNNDGDKYENIIKLLPCNFIALSATFRNIDFLKDKLQQIHPEREIKYIEYNSRFINHQRWIYTDKLNKIHPLSLFSFDELITIDFENYNLPFTPNDAATLWELFDKLYPDFDYYESLENDIEKCSPDYYFSDIKDDRLLHLNEYHTYEKFLKSELSRFCKLYPDFIQCIIHNFVIKSDCIELNEIKLLNSLKSTNLLPSIIFCNNNIIDIFRNINKGLIDLENQAYPYYNDILKYKDKLYNLYIKKRDKFKESISVNKSTNVKFLIQEKLENFETTEIDIYTNLVITYYEQKINKINKSNISYELKVMQIKNLEKELIYFKKNPILEKQDVYKKHPQFCYTCKDPMNETVIKNIKKMIKENLNLNIKYESIVFQMLKRGIGLYVTDMPNEYKWLIHKLLINRDIGIVISDKILCMGIDLPIKTTVFYGSNNEYTQEDFLQMSGRAGRRGKDSEGNIVFYNINNWNQLMKGKLPAIIGSSKGLQSSYSILSSINPKIKINNIFSNFINENRKIDKIEYNISKNTSINLLYWNLKEYKYSKVFIDLLINNNEIITYNKFEKEIYLLNLIKKYLLFFDDQLISQYKLNKCNIDEVDIFKNIFTICINLYNVFLNKDKSKSLINYSNIITKMETINLDIKKILLDTLKNIINKCKHIILSNSGISLII